LFSDEAFIQSSLTSQREPEPKQPDPEQPESEQPEHEKTTDQGKLFLLQKKNNNSLFVLKKICQNLFFDNYLQMV